ncbi:MAG: InlB B-repeat-containing protein, partial [Defluviitaleaceae bacterium]|nr:InlB B-repeat-containing protein [Defluviitaleaceae bacterium]
TDGGELSQTVLQNGAATEPELERDGFVFNGWSGAFNNITANTTVTAQWLRIGAIASGGTGTITSADVAFLARVVALHTGFSVSNQRIANLRGLNRPPKPSDITLLAKMLVGYDLEDLREMTEPE